MVTVGAPDNEWRTGGGWLLSNQKLGVFIRFMRRRIDGEWRMVFHGRMVGGWSISKMTAALFNVWKKWRTFSAYQLLIILKSDHQQIVWYNSSSTMLRAMIRSLYQYLSQDIIIAHLDLFYAECCAYGRIVDEKRNGKIFVRCHGFTSISALQKALFSQKFNVSKRKTLLEEYDRPAFKKRNH